MTRAAGRTRGQAGQSLIEVIVAILLVGTILLAVAGAFFTLTGGTELNEQAGGANAGLVAYGEILRTQVPYRNCNGTIATDYTADASAFIDGANEAAASTTVTNWRLPAGWSVRVVGVDAWDPVNQAFVSGCRASPSPDAGAQRVRYEVTALEVTRTAEVVKRREDVSP